ncbi:hypothetical protein PINS_up011238 [Pythium insidiosum]|nr:hypothetical protein PINS_up011238 [Pythium insidiosum]
MRESSSNMNALIKKRMEAFRDVAVLMDSKHISCQQLASKSSWVPDALRKSCYVCTRSFGPTRHRHHCRLCGEVVCKKCLVVRNATVAAQPGRSVVSKLKVCMFCVQKTRTKSTSSASSAGTIKREMSRASDRSASPRSTFNHTVGSSQDRESLYSTDTDRSSQFSFEPSFLIRSPSRRYSEMSVATTIFERDDTSGNDFAADLYIDTQDMAVASYLSPHSSHSSDNYSVGSSGSNSQYQPQQLHQQQQQQRYRAVSSGASSRQGVHQHQVASRDRGASGGFQFQHLDQQLAEQQELLRRMAIASHDRGTARRPSAPTSGSYRR